MKKWLAVIILASAQFVMVLDSTVMNVSISEVVKSLNTTVSGLQFAITFYTLTMAAFMLLGGKLGDNFGRLKIFRIGAIIYGVGSLMTGLSQNLPELVIGWSIIEGLGAVMVIPAVAALVASNYKGRDRVTAYAIIGGISGAAAAAGPLIGGFVTTYLSWRYVFIAETAIMLVILLSSSKLLDNAKIVREKIDIPSVLLSASGMAILVFGMLQSKTWGWITPRTIPEIAGHSVAPLGISLTAYLIVLGSIVLYRFYRRQQRLEATKQHPLLRTSLFKITQLRSGLWVLGSQYAIIASVFFALPIYLQMTLGFDALQTGIKILPLSVGIVLFSILGTRLAGSRSPKQIVRYGQYLLILGAIVLLAAISPELKGLNFGLGMVILGAGLGLLASQLGNINMSSVGEKQTGEVGGLQGVAQNLGSSLGTALIGSVLIGSLSTNFIKNINASDLPASVKTTVQQQTSSTVAVVSSQQVDQYAQQKGVPAAEASQISSIYDDSQVDALKVSLFAILLISILALALSRDIPDKKPS